VLDNHSDPLDVRIRSDLEAFLTKLWTQLAAHYRGRPSSLLLELQNEPHEIVPAQWDALQHRLLKAVRAVDPERIIVLTGADWGSVTGMLALSRSDDAHIVYTFHCYDPFRFTHQGASWAGQGSLWGVRFPVPGDEATLARTLDAVVKFSVARGVPVWCGEFGVYDLRADAADRVAWYRTFRSLLEQRSLPWTMWDYRGSFGLFNKGSTEVFDQDLNLPLVAALGFHTVPQRAPGPVAETAGFVLYDEGWAPGSRQGGSHRMGVVNGLDETKPHAGAFSLRLSGLEQYAGPTWDFAPWKDLSALQAGAVSLWVRSTAARFSVDLRFVDGSGPAPDALPWRNSVTVDERQVPGDGQWHRVTIPLAALVETGAWDGQWHPAQKGAFAWNRVARFEIIAEKAPLNGDLWFDEVNVLATMAE